MNSQGSKAYGDLTSTFAESATITINGQTKSVTDDDIFTIQGSFSADSKASINSQSVNFHTSCSVTLQTGDRYGPLEVLAGGQCPMPDPCGMHGCCPVEAEAPGQETTPCTDAGCNNCYQDPCGVYGCCADGTFPTALAPHHHANHRPASLSCTSRGRRKKNAVAHTIAYTMAHTIVYTIAHTTATKQPLTQYGSTPPTDDLQ